MTTQQSFREVLEVACADIEAQIAAGWMPPSLKQEARRVLNWARDVIRAVETDDAALRDELLKAGVQFDTWIQDFDRFRLLVVSGAVVGDDAAATVTIRWDLLVGEAQRKAATSLATELVDAYRGRSAGGRPRN